MSKKSILMCVCIALCAAMAMSGTLAYLTSTDSDVNVMTLGNVKIDQFEYERVVDDKGDPVEGVEGTDFKADYGITQSYKLQPFTQGKPAYPAVYTNEDHTVAWDEFQQLWNQVGAPGSNDLFDNSVKNVVDKFVFVKNTGSSNAYYRTIVAIEAPENIGEGGIHLNFNANSRFDYNVAQEGAQTSSDSNKFYTEIGGTRYAVYTATYTEVLTPGEVSRPSLLQLYLDPQVNNEQYAALGEKWDVLVVTQAVQAAGFSDANTALEAAFGKVSADSHPWIDMDDENNTNDQAPDNVKIPVLVSNANELVAALEAGDSVVMTDDVKIDPAGLSNAYGTTGLNQKNGGVIDGGNNVLDIKGAGGTWDSGINTTGGTIKNITVTGSFRGIFINHDSNKDPEDVEPVVLENVTIDGTTYTVSCDQGMNQTLLAKNSTFKGWTSYAATLGDATFTDCYFGKGNGYSFMRPYAPTTYVDCEFEAGYTLDPRADVVLDNCTLDGAPITMDNVTDLVTSTDKVTVK